MCIGILTQCAKDCSNEDPMQIFFKGFYKYFSKFLHVRNQEIKLNMPKNYVVNIFEYEGLNL